jgi:hypothetical protein
MKSDGHLGRCHLKGQNGDAANVILTAVGHNLRRISRLAEGSAAPNPARSIAGIRPRATGQMGFLTADSLSSGDKSLGMGIIKMSDTPLGRFVVSIAQRNEEPVGARNKAMIPKAPLSRNKPADIEIDGHGGISGQMIARIPRTVITKPWSAKRCQ